jgi:hypothetical protein
MDSSALPFSAFCLTLLSIFSATVCGWHMGYLDNATWSARHAEKLRSKDNPSRDDRLFLLLFDTPERTPADTRSLTALIRIERAKETVRSGRIMIRESDSARAKAARRDRDHERYLASGLLTMVGLLDGQTGKPTWDRATLLGALDAMAKVDASEEQKRRWKARGEALLAKPGDHAESLSKTI